MSPEERHLLDAAATEAARLRSRVELLTNGLRQCKAAVQDTSRPASARCELVRDIATPLLIYWRDLPTADKTNPQT